MKGPLNFGPSEATREQRENIANLALAIIAKEGRLPTEELSALYEQYVDGKTDLYHISLLVQEETRQRLLELVEIGS